MVTVVALVCVTVMALQDGRVHRTARELVTSGCTTTAVGMERGYSTGPRGTHAIVETVTFRADGVVRTVIPEHSVAGDVQDFDRGELLLRYRCHEPEVVMTDAAAHHAAGVWFPLMWWSVVGMCLVPWLVAGTVVLTVRARLSRGGVTPGSAPTARS